MRPLWVRYALSLIISGIVIFIKLRFNLFLSEVPFILVSVAVVLSTLLGGFGPGILSVFITTAAIIYFFFGLDIFLNLSKFSKLFQSAVYFSSSIFLVLIVDRQMRIERQIIEQNSSIKTILTSIPDAVIKVDADERVIFWNKTASEIYGYSPREATNKKLRDLLHSRWIKPGDEKSEYLHLRKYGYWRGELIQKRKDGREIFIESKVNSINNIDGKIVSMIAVNRDISDRMRKEKKKDEFISIASHELKTPITTIKGYLQMLQQQPAIQKDSRSSLFVRRTLTHVNQLVDLINDLLDVTRIQSGKMQYRMSGFDLARLIADLAEEMRPTAGNRKISLTKMKKTMVFGDIERITQVFVNLLTNAIKYSPDNTLIEMDMRNSGGKTLVSVKDQGIGIPKDKVKKIFDRFYRVGNNKVSGLGIGLFISREIVKRHRGRIWADSEEGNGSTFFVELPTIYRNKELRIKN